MKRWIAVALCTVLLMGAPGVLPCSVTAATETVLIAGSDFQVSNNNTTQVERLLNTLTVHGIQRADGAFFVGDYTLQPTESNLSTDGINKLKEVFAPLVGDAMIFTQGNHDSEKTVGLSPAGGNDPDNKAYGVFVIHEDQYRELGNDRQATKQMAVSLRAYLEEKQQGKWNKPIFILNHIPLHWSNRTLKDGSGTDADLIFDVLNEYGEKGLNLIYLCGHNHSNGYDDFLGGSAVYLKKGDTMEVCYGDKTRHKTRTLHFTYMNAGYIGYYSTESEVDSALTLSVFRIQADGSVIITRYDTDLNFHTAYPGVHNLKSKGVWHKNFSKEGYHATPNVQVYASSRRVTATTDEAVETPMPRPTEESSTTSGQPTTAQSTAASVDVGTTTLPPTTTATDAEEDPMASSTTDTAPESTSTTMESAGGTPAQAPFRWWPILAVAGVVLVGSLMAVLLLVSKRT